MRESETPNLVPLDAPLSWGMWRDLLNRWSYPAVANWIHFEGVLVIAIGSKFKAEKSTGLREMIYYGDTYHYRA